MECRSRCWRAVDERTALEGFQLFEQAMSVEDMAAVCHSEFPEIVNQVMSFSAFQPIGLSLQLIIELLVTARTKPLIVKVHPKTRTAAIIILSILIQFSHYSP